LKVMGDGLNIRAGNCYRLAKVLLADLELFRPERQVVRVVGINLKSFGIHFQSLADAGSNAILTSFDMVYERAACSEVVLKFFHGMMISLWLMSNTRA